MGKRASSTENGMHLFVFGSSFTSWDGAHSWAKTAHKPRDVRRERKMKSTGASAPQPKHPKINGFYLRWSRAENNLHRFVHRYSVNVRALRLCAICWVCVCVYCCCRVLIPLDFAPIFGRWELALLHIDFSTHRFRQRNLLSAIPTNTRDNNERNKNNEWRRNAEARTP